jgi:hypothetical protein
MPEEKGPSFKVSGKEYRAVLKIRLSVVDQLMTGR